MANLKNINFMSKTRFDSTTTSDDELYLVDYGDIDFVVESQVDGTNWCRVYKSGWVEQGGYTATNGVVTYKKPFKNTDYTLVGGLIPGNASATYEHLNMGTQTTTGFTYTRYDNYNLKWYACGQGA